MSQSHGAILPVGLPLDDPDEYGLRGRYERHLRAGHRPRTIETYLAAYDSLVGFLTDQGMPREAGAIRREHIEAWLVWLRDTGRSQGTLNNRYRALTALWRWLVEEGELQASPMAKMKPPTVPDVPVPVLREEQLRALIAACSGRDFESRRDEAMLRLFIDSMLRRAELGDLQVDDLDLGSGQVFVTGKGGRPRVVPFGARTAKALDRYMVLRRRHPFAKARALWLGKKGPLADNSILQAVRRRGRQAGIDGLYPHVLRHTFAHTWLADGGNEGDLMRIAGWRSREMLARYGAFAADARAHDAHRRMALGDRI